MQVLKITTNETKPFILNKHYAQRMPSVSYAYGLFINGILEGICTIGKPASNSLCEGVCGKEHKSRVFELNRLCINEGHEKNTLSWFLSRVLKSLKDEDIIIVSYADEGANHHGYIYQATNWIYTGKTKERTDKYTPDGKHSRHYTEEYNHLRKFRTSKHRYIWFTNKKDIKLLNYNIEPYPKGENKKYILGTKIKTKILNQLTQEVFYE